MTRSRALTLAISVLFSAAIISSVWIDGALVTAAAPDNWPQWRGPDHAGANEDSDLPLSWSESENILWKVAIPGKGSSTPIVWGDRVFVQTAVSEKASAQPAAAVPGARGGRRRR